MPLYCLSLSEEELCSKLHSFLVQIKARSIGAFQCASRFFHFYCLMLWSWTVVGSTIISSVLLTFIFRWCWSHHSMNLSTPDVWLTMLLFLLSRLSITVSSENFETNWLGFELTQSSVYKVNKRDELTVHCYLIVMSCFPVVFSYVLLTTLIPVSFFYGKI